MQMYNFFFFVATHALPSSLSSSPFAVHLPIDMKRLRNGAWESGGEKVSFELRSTFNFFFFLSISFSRSHVAPSCSNSFAIALNYLIITLQFLMRILLSSNGSNIVSDFSSIQVHIVRRGYSRASPSRFLLSLQVSILLFFSLPLSLSHSVPFHFSLHINFMLYITISCFICVHIMWCFRKISMYIFITDGYNVRISLKRAFYSRSFYIALSLNEMVLDRLKLTLSYLRVKYASRIFNLKFV